MTLQERAEAVAADPRDVRAAEAVLERAQAGLVILSSVDAGLAYAVASTLADRDTPAEYRAFDIHHAVPDGASWTVAELESLVIHPARIRPYSRAHVIVADADQMTAALSDRLLKVVEEPNTDVLFWFCVSDDAALAPTLVGRATAALSIRPTPAEQRMQVVVDAGASPEDASAILALCGSDMRLATAVARHGKLADLETFSTTPLVSDRPTTAADEVLAAIMSLSAAMSAPPARRSSRAAKERTGRPKWSELPATAKADGRRLLRTLLTARSASVRDQVVAAQSAQQLSHSERCLRALATARAELATNASPATALPALWNRSAPY